MAMQMAECRLLVAGRRSCSMAPQPAQPARPPIKHDVVVDGHHLAVWQQKPAQPRAAILLIHGRTWSSLPNFDLQVPGERRSFMDALADAGLDVFAVDLRGYGATPRDPSGWLTPDRAVADVHAVVAWIQQQRSAQARAADLSLRPVARRDGGGDGGAAASRDDRRRRAARIRLRSGRAGSAPSDPGGAAGALAATSPTPPPPISSRTTPTPGRR